MNPVQATNVELKARCSDLDAAARLLHQLGAAEVGTQQQVDTYFIVPHGRLKLREQEGNSALVHYDRANDPDAKTATATLYETVGGAALKRTLGAALGVMVIVDKTRREFEHDNVRFHLDDVRGLGTFIEIEVRSYTEEPASATMQADCAAWKRNLRIADAQLVAGSYSDLIIAGRS